MEEIEGVEEVESSGVETGESQDTPTEPTESDAAPKETQTNNEPTTPFHEHPRFKELVEQKNQALQAQRALEQKLQEIERRVSQHQQPQTPQAQARDELIEDLKKIDPRLAERLERFTQGQTKVDELLKKLEGLEKKDQQRDQQAVVQTAVSKINQLHETNKVSPELKQMINDKLDLLYMQGKLNLQNLDATYKQSYEAFKKYEDTLTRTVRESYVKDKKQDAQVPTSQPKGTPAKPAPKKPNWSKDPEVAKAQVVSRYLKQIASEKEAS